MVISMNNLIKNNLSHVIGLNVAVLVSMFVMAYASTGYSVTLDVVAIACVLAVVIFISSSLSKSATKRKYDLLINEMKVELEETSEQLDSAIEVIISKNIELEELNSSKTLLQRRLEYKSNVSSPLFVQKQVGNSFAKLLASEDLRIDFSNPLWYRMPNSDYNQEYSVQLSSRQLEVIVDSFGLNEHNGRPMRFEVCNP